MRREVVCTISRCHYRRNGLRYIKDRRWFRSRKVRDLNQNPQGLACADGVTRVSSPGYGHHQKGGFLMDGRTLVSG